MSSLLLASLSSGPPRLPARLDEEMLFEEAQVEKCQKFLEQDLHDLDGLIHALLECGRSNWRSLMEQRQKRQADQDTLDLLKNFMRWTCTQPGGTLGKGAGSSPPPLPDGIFSPVSQGGEPSSSDASAVAGGVSQSSVEGNAQPGIPNLPNLQSLRLQQQSGDSPFSPSTKPSPFSQLGLHRQGTIKASSLLSDADRDAALRMRQTEQGSSDRER